MLHNVAQLHLEVNKKISFSLKEKTRNSDSIFPLNSNILSVFPVTRGLRQGGLL